MRKPVLFAAVVLLLSVMRPANAQFCPGAAPWVFDDVPASDLFCGSITWAAQHAITLGCAIIDANHRLYCPNDAVTRGQMAAFVNRLGNVRVEAVGTGPGLTGGPITSVGTINLAQTQLLPTVTCATGQVPGWNGAAWVCADPNTFGDNVYLADSISSAVGNVLKAGTRFIHNYGSDNTFVGKGAGNFTMTGYANTGSGANALASNTSGIYNTASGLGALMSNTAGWYNTAVGVSALRVNTTGVQNTAVGLNALQFNSGDSNTAVGVSALNSNSSGSGNIAIGYRAGINLTTGDDNIAIGSPGLLGEGATIRIGDAAQVRTFVAGIRGVTTGANNAVNVVIDGNGQLGTISSSREAKDDIADMDDASAALRQLRPVVFRYKADRDPTGPRLQYGLIAEEVAEVYPGLVAGDAHGNPETVMYQYLAPMLLNEYQKQQRTIEAQARELAELRRAVETLLAGMPR